MFTNKFIKTMALLLGLWSLNSQGSVIYYGAIEVNPVEDLWRYNYQIVDADFSDNEGFDIYFPADNPYQPDDLGILGAANADWDVKAYQPDPALPHYGFLDGMALMDNPSLQGLFYIDFIWRGGKGTPGTQHYNFYDINFAIIKDSEGQTVPFPNKSVPEPETLLLMLIGLGGYFVKHKSGRSTG